METLLEGEDPKRCRNFLNMHPDIRDFPENFVPPSLIDLSYVPPTNYSRFERYTCCMAVLMTAMVLARL